MGASTSDNETSAAAAAAAVASTSATEELYHSNLLRLQASELLSESVLHLSSNSSGIGQKEVRWSKDVTDYIETVKETMNDMKRSMLSPDTVQTKKNRKGKEEGESDENEHSEDHKQKFMIQFFSDKAYNHCTTSEKWTFLSPEGSDLLVTPINSYVAGGAGLTTATSNANVLPTIDVGVFIPSIVNDETVSSSSKDEDDDDHEVSMIDSKDFLNGRYFDKRNILAIHIAKYLSQKKQRKKIGSVHYRKETDGDFRKVSLILTPPVVKKKSSKEKQTKKKKKSAENESVKMKKTRFRIRLVFGVQEANHIDHKRATTGWIPSVRLFPNRCNNKVIPSSLRLDKRASPDTFSVDYDGTPSYNNALSVDLHHWSTTQILSNIFSPTSTASNRSFIEAWALLKIWCLQRGFLRGHDTFTDKCLGLSLAYLVRKELITYRMDPLQIFIVWLKFMTDNDWLGEDKLDKDAEVASDTIRHTSSQAYQDVNKMVFSAKEKKRNKAALVMPNDMFLSESETVAKSEQKILYDNDFKANGAAIVNSGRSSQDVQEAVLPKTLLECYKIYCDGPVFLNPSMTVNYFSHLSPSFIREVKMESRKALSCIHLSSSTSLGSRNQFHQLFFDHVRFWRRYDAYVKIKVSDIDLLKYMSNSREDKSWGKNVQDLGCYEFICRELLRILHMALGDRVTALRLLTTGNGETTNDLHRGPEEHDDRSTKRMDDSDETLSFPILGETETSSVSYPRSVQLQSPVAAGSHERSTIVIGIRLNPETCNRIVDRGPPAEDTTATKEFKSLWGTKAQLRRFKDGAIVNAVVWNDVENDMKNSMFQFEGDEKVGGTVERIIRHIVGTHFGKDDARKTRFMLRDVTSLIEGIVSGQGSSLIDNSADLHKSISSAFDALAKILRDYTAVSPKTGSSKLGLPLPIDSVEALSPSLRSTELFPPMPNPFLGSATKGDGKKASTMTLGDPILLQIQFDEGSKWPTDINAMGAAKCAMLMQLAEGIEDLRDRGDPECLSFDGSINVTPTHMDFGFLGYPWRIIVRANQELKMLDSLRNPSPEAVSLRATLHRRHVVKPLHHFTILGVHTKYPASSQVVRLAKRWLAAHMFSGLVPHEAIELIVAGIFTNSSSLYAPSSVICGFMRFLHVLASHDWIHQPFIVDPEGHINQASKSIIMSQFEELRGKNFQKGPAMFIVSPHDEYDGEWQPSTAQQPERVILSRLCSLAHRSYQHLLTISKSDRVDKDDTWSAVFQESSNSLQKYSSLIRVNESLIVDHNCSSTGGGDLRIVSSSKGSKGGMSSPYKRSMERRKLGLKAMRKTVYRNLNSSNNEDGLLYCWNPIEAVVSQLRRNLGHLALFFYNELTPDIIAVVWRPQMFTPKPFATAQCEFKRPVEDVMWSEDCLVTTNLNDVMHQIRFLTRHVAVDIKILHDPSTSIVKKNLDMTKKRKVSSIESESDEEDSD